MVAENDRVNRLTVPFKAEVISRMVLNRARYTTFVDNSMYLYRTASEYINRGQGFQICGENLPLCTSHVIRHMRSGCNRIVSGILWAMSELITQERIGIRSSNLVDWRR